MSDNKASRKRRIREVYWICDKKNCNTSNRRTVSDSDMLYDDICDYCHHRIHEPLLIDIRKNDK